MESLPNAYILGLIYALAPAMLEFFKFVHFFCEATIVGFYHTMLKATVRRLHLLQPNDLL